MSCCRLTKAGLPAAFGAAILGGGLLATGHVPALAQTEAPPAAVPETPGTRAANQLSDAFRRVIKSVQPAVVAVRIEADRERADVRTELPDMFDNMPEGMRRQFERQFRGLRRRNPDIPDQNAGSGVIIDPTGVVLTNNHVVEDASRVFVVLDDGRELQAREWKTDPASDLAVVYLEGEQDLPSAPLGDSDAVEIGDWVLAFGNPFNIGTTVTQGIVSARHRSARLNDREDYLQTDAAINPGNSGGPLVNLRGQIVGINTAISSRSGGYDGVGFAIPANMVSWVTEQLMTEGKVTRSYLGVVMVDLTRDMQRFYGLGPRDGVVVNDVRPGTPAENAGLQAGDVIRELDGRPISGGMELAGLIERVKPGSAVPMKIQRNGEAMTVTVTFESMPENYYAGGGSSPQTDNPNKNSLRSPKETVDRLGLEVRPLTEEAAAEFGVEEDAGVLIADVERGTPSSRAGLRAGDVIVMVNGKNTLTLDSFREAIKEAEGRDQVMLAVRRGGQQSLILLNR